jgi:hypothetical protein
LVPFESLQPAIINLEVDRTFHAVKDVIQLPIGDYEPPVMLVPTLTVNTANGYNPSMADIVSFMMPLSKKIAP